MYKSETALFPPFRSSYMAAGNYLTGSDIRFGQCACRIRAYACYDSKKRSDNKQMLKSAPIEKIKEWDGEKFGDPIGSFAKKMGRMSRYIEYKMDGKGCLKVRHKNNAMTFFRNRIGILKNEPDGRHGRTGDPVRARGCLPIEFPAFDDRGPHADRRAEGDDEEPDG